MKNTNKKTSLAPIEKVLLLAGIALIALGCLANVWSAYVNMRFINYPIDSLYYLRYIVVLGGGFLAGYLLTQARTDRRLFNGTIYATLAVAIYPLLDQLRAFASDFTDHLPFPWGKMVFLGMPLFSLLIVLAFAGVSRLRKRSQAIGTAAQWTLIIAFAMYQAIFIATVINASSLTSSLWLLVLNPLVIASLTYAALKKLSSRLTRLFYAALIGTFYYTFVIVLWELRTDSSAEATNIFSATALIVTLTLTTALVWRARKALK